MCSSRHNPNEKKMWNWQTWKVKLVCSSRHNLNEPGRTTWNHNHPSLTIKTNTSGRRNLLQFLCTNDFKLLQKMARVPFKHISFCHFFKDRGFVWNFPKLAVIFCSQPLWRIKSLCPGSVGEMSKSSEWPLCRFANTIHILYKFTKNSNTLQIQIQTQAQLVGNQYVLLLKGKESGWILYHCIRIYVALHF